MKRRSDSGLNIERRASGTLPVSQVLTGCLAGAAAFAALGGTIAYGTEMFGKISLVPAMAVGLACCVLPMFRGKRASRIAAVVPAALVLLYVLLFRERISDGLCIAYNGWCEMRPRASGVLELGLETAGSAGAASLTMFSIVASCLLAFITTSLARLRLPVLPAVCAVSAGIQVLLLGAQSSPLWTAVLLTVGTAILASGSMTHSGGVGCRAAGAASAIIAAVIFSGVAFAVPQLRNGTAFQQMTSEIKSSLHTAVYEKADSNLPEGDFTGLAEKTSSGQEMLRVTRGKPETLYLRGFVGEIYTGSGWEPIDSATLAENSGALYWVHEDGFYPQTQTADAARLLEEAVDIETMRVTVENTGACAKYVYVPYGAGREGISDLLYSEKLEPDAVTDGKLSQGIRTYSVIRGDTELIPDMVDALNVSDDDSVSEYLKSEAVYREFAEKFALDIPEKVRDAISPLLDKYTGENMTSTQAVGCVGRFIDSSMSYREDTDAFPDGEDFVSWTLKEGEGYDIHYATLTVLALRYCGVPARYVEGYVVNGDAAASAENGVISVDDTCAHAWAEIYIEGVGWIPVDLTPGYEDSPGVLPQAGEDIVYVSNTEDPDSEIGTVNGDGSGASADSGAEYDNGREQDAQTSEDEGDAPDDAPVSRTAVTLIKTYLPWLLLLIPAAVIVLVLRRAYIKKRREKLFRCEDVSEAVGWSFAHAAVILKTAGIDRKNGSMAALAGAVNEYFGEEYCGRFMAMCDLNSEALFSGRELDEGKREQMSEFRKITLELVRKKTGALKRIRYQWIDCLY